MPTSRLPAAALTLAALIVAACTATPPPRLPAEVEVRADAAQVERGRYLVHGPAHCASCHDAEGGASPANAALSGGRRFDLGPLGSFVAPNLTNDAESGIGAWSDAELFRVLRTGRTRQGRPLAPLMDTTGMADDDLLAVIAYLRTQPPVKRHVAPSDPGLVARLALHWVIGPPSTPSADHPPAPGASAQVLGDYLANRVANCKGCHTPRSSLTGRLLDRPYRGGLELVEHGRTFIVPDITAQGALQDLSEDEFIDLFRSKARQPTASPMPWSSYNRMNDDELAGIYRYLKSLGGRT